MGARNRVGIGLPYRPVRIYRLAELIPGLLKSFQIWVLVYSTLLFRIIIMFFLSKEQVHTRRKGSHPPVNTLFIVVSAGIVNLLHLFIKQL
jgi:hypothetical protein